MAENNELWFEVGPSGENVLVRVHVCAPRHKESGILKRLFTALENREDILTLLNTFPENSKILPMLKVVLAQGIIDYEKISVINWTQRHGHNICIPIKPCV